MRFGGITPVSLLLIFLIIIALFGTNKIKTMGADLGNAIKSFRRAMNEEEKDEPKNYQQ